MRLLLAILVIAVLAPLVEWFSPWWTAAIVAGIVGFLSKLRTGQAFLAGFLGLGLSWLVFILVRSIGNDSLLSNRMAQVFQLPSSLLYVLVTFVLGGIVGGLSAWAGAHLRKLISTNRALA
jgi:hypothetical protein